MTTPTQSPQERRGDLGESLLGGPLPKRWSTALYADRHDAGRRLGALLADRRFEDPLVVGIARGGMPVAAEVAHALGAPLDIVIVRKIGAPWNRDLAIGAVAEGDLVMVDERAVAELGLCAQEVDEAVARALEELARTIDRLREGRPRIGVRGRSVILVDDGLATGRIAQAAIRALRERGALHITLALPVGAPESVQALADSVDEALCAATPQHLRAIGDWYADFRATSDEEMLALLAGHSGAAARSALISSEPGISAHGDLIVPWSAPGHGVIVFAPSGPSHAEAQLTAELAGVLERSGFGTLSLDWPQIDSPSRGERSEDVQITAQLMRAATDWLRSQPESARLPIGYVGGGAGAAGALVAAAQLRSALGALVALAPRLELTGGAIALLEAPTLLVVPEQDRELLAICHAAREAMQCESRIALLPGRSPLALDRRARESLAPIVTDWLARHISAMTQPPGGAAYACSAPARAAPARSVISGARTDPRDNPQLPLPG